MTIKLSVSEIRFFSIVLSLLAKSPTGSLVGGDLIRLAERSGWLSSVEKSSVPSRTDSRFANKIHNEVSHRTSRRNMIRTGMIHWSADLQTFTITDRGWKFLGEVSGMLTGVTTPNPAAVGRWLSDLTKQ